MREISTLEGNRCCRSQKSSDRSSCSQFCKRSQLCKQFVADHGFETNYNLYKSYTHGMFFAVASDFRCEQPLVLIPNYD